MAHILASLCIVLIFAKGISIPVLTNLFSVSNARPWREQACSNLGIFYYFS